MHALQAAFRRLSTSIEILSTGWRDGRSRPAWDHACADLRRAVASWLASPRAEELALEAFGCALVVSEMIDTAGRGDLAAASALMMAERDAREVLDRMELLISESAFDDEADTSEIAAVAPPAGGALLSSGEEQRHVAG